MEDSDPGASPMAAPTILSSTSTASGADSQPLRERQASVVLQSPLRSTSSFLASTQSPAAAQSSLSLSAAPSMRTSVPRALVHKSSTLLSGSLSPTAASAGTSPAEAPPPATTTPTTTTIPPAAATPTARTASQSQFSSFATRQASSVSAPVPSIAPLPSPSTTPTTATASPVVAAEPTTLPAVALDPDPPTPKMSGMKPIVPLRKRGQSFRETSSVVSTVGDDGRRHLNQYTFHEELGRGAYGVVVKVEATESKELFAAKIVNKKALKRIRVGRFGNALQSTKKELAIWKRFKHRHIVVLHEVIDTEDSDELYMISELVEGGPVLDGEEECTPLSPEQTKLFFCHLIEGLDFLHENKIIHRDIKPGNLLLKKFDDGETVLKLADFGVSHEMESDNDTLRQTAGTAIFMEMLTGDNFHGKPVDIWACGITLYMFVYGHPPFTAKTMTELYRKILNEPIPYPATVGERVVEEDLLDLLQHILEKDPAKRYTIPQIRAHRWAWNDFQVSAVKCVTHAEGRRSSFSRVPRSLADMVSVGRSLRSIFGRTKPVYPMTSHRGSVETLTSMQPEPPA